MKRIFWISILLVFSIASCKKAPIENYKQENIVVGSQSMQLTFSSEQPVYEGTTALPTNLVIENKSDQPIYLPWGNDPGYILIIVGLDSTYRTTFGKLPLTPEAKITEYFSIQPGEKITGEFPLHPMPEPGRYSVCAEIFLFGNAADNQMYNVEFSSMKPNICIMVVYK